MLWQLVAQMQRKRIKTIKSVRGRHLARVPTSRYDVWCHLQETHLLVICLFMLSVPSCAGEYPAPPSSMNYHVPLSPKSDGMYTVYN
jgi:hypothetical protein